MDKAGRHPSQSGARPCDNHVFVVSPIRFPRRQVRLAGVRVVSAVGRRSRRMMRFETDPAMSRSAIRRQPIAARISRWSSCLTSRWTHPQLTSSGSSGSRLRFGGLLFFLVHAGTSLSASNGCPLRHMACSTTASLRATATFARLNPMRSRSLRPQRRRSLSVRARVRIWAAASYRYDLRSLSPCRDILP